MDDGFIVIIISLELIIFCVTYGHLFGNASYCVSRKAETKDSLCHNAARELNLGRETIHNKKL
jgi:hypothetical protein